MARTLWGLIALLLVLIGLVPLVARASSCPGYDNAMALCQADGQAKTAQFSSWNCSLGTGTLANSVVLNYVGINGHVGSMGPYGSPINCPGFDPLADQCKARPPLHQAFDGTHTTVVNAGCTYTLKTDDDAAVKVCGVWNGKQYCTGTATWTPSGAYSGTPATNPDPSPQAPKVCGGGSCYDPSGNQYCASTGSGQVCVPASGAGSASGCSSSGGTTLCAGSPPPRPPNPPVADPSSQIASSDNFTGQTGVGAVSNVTVNNYNGTGSGANNGAGAGDTGAPASSSTAPSPPGDGTSAGGGGDCNTPPRVEGSPALGLIAQQTWLLRCSEAGQVTDDSNATVPGLDDVGTTPGDGFSKEVTVLDKLDTSGFGGGTQCPKLPDLDLGSLGHYSLNSDWWCDLLSKTGYMIMMLATWFALRILGEK